MTRLCTLVLGLLLCAGCMSEETKKQWHDVWVDLSGDNMQMRSDRLEKSP
jgi:hypothetical protein